VGEEVGQEEATPLEQLGVMAAQEVDIHPGLTHLELFTRRGLLTVLWHGPAQAAGAVVACGGAMGGLLGPANGFYQFLGDELAALDLAVLRVGWRVPNDLGLCTLDLAAVTELVCRRGAERVVTMGHSFGGAVAVRVAVALPAVVAGVMTFATQSAGCEIAEGIETRPLVLFHGDADEILHFSASEMVRMIAGTGQLVLLPGSGHLLTQASGILRTVVPPWVTSVLAGESPGPIDITA
jgi:alpha-beta hydrolase superfamily lysophospholipase